MKPSEYRAHKNRNFDDPLKEMFVVTLARIKELNKPANKADGMTFPSAVGGERNDCL
jgi:hypothetical protein